MELVDTWTLLVVPDPTKCRDFYVEHLGFEVVFDAGWYVQMQLAGQHHLGLAFMETDHPSQPPQHHAATSGSRFVSIQVAEVDALAARLVAAGVTVDVSLRDEPWGQRHIIVVDPAGTFVDLIQAIEPDPAFAERWFS